MYYQYYNGNQWEGGQNSNHRVPNNSKPIPLVNGKYTERNTMSEKGNVCAYVPVEPVNYYKLQVQHWPSQDYAVTPPKGYTHTDLTAQNDVQMFMDNSWMGY